MGMGDRESADLGVIFQSDDCFDAGFSKAGLNIASPW
jgi:hypothetical protein